jgi:hypothetical protein
LADLQDCGLNDRASTEARMRHESNGTVFGMDSALTDREPGRQFHEVSS